LRYPSSASSIESTFHTSTADSPSSPTFTSSKTGKRSLPDVQEEPQERDEDFDMFDDAIELYDCLCKSSCAAPSVVNKMLGNIANACNNRR
jgi:hypothetical protein